MRTGCAVLALAVLVVSVTTRADTAQPLPINGTCSVPADPQWTRQEKFVWQHVCVGDIANFNAGSDYGGHLDPKRPEGLPDGRILRPTFLETILLADKYRHALTRRGVRIIGARFTETVDLENAQLGHELWLAGSLLEKGANFRRLKSARAILLNDSKVTGTLNMEGLEVDKDLLLVNSALSEALIRDAHVSGQIFMANSKVIGTLNMEELLVDKRHSLRRGRVRRGYYAGYPCWQADLDGWL